jgi:hypothetical protein
MSFFPSEVLLKLADTRHKDLIAYVPDSSFEPLAMRLVSGRVDIADLFKSAKLLGLQIEEGDYITVSPSNRADAERTRVNRTEFAKLIGAIAKKGYASLDEMCRYAVVMPDWEARSLDAKWLSAYDPSTAATFDAGKTEFMRIYGLLTPAQKATTQANVRLLASTMSGQQRAVLERIVYSSFGGPRIIGKGAISITSTTRGGAEGNAGEQPEPEIVRLEPTEAFPNGLPNDASLELSRRWEDGVFALDSKGKGRFLSAGDLGLRMGMDTSKFPPGSIADSKFEKYQLADLVYIDLALRFGARNRTGDLRDASTRTGAAITFDQLPQGFRDNVDKARQQAANMKTISFGSGRGAPPPR